MRLEQGFATDISPSTARDSLAGSWTSKLSPQHYEGLAIVYVRQSTPQQVLHHRESTIRQYSLVDLAVRLGWSADRIEVIDEDQGQSGATGQGRIGFQ